MKILYDGTAPIGRQFGLSLNGETVKGLSRIDIESYLDSRGVCRKQVRAEIAAAKIGVHVSRTTNLIAEFIAEHCHAVDGALIRFGEFRERFLASLPPIERHDWTPLRVSRSLPPQHQSGNYTGNVTYIPNVSWEPCEPSRRFVVVRGNGRTRLVRQRA